MPVLINLLEVPKDGVQVDCEVDRSGVSLSPEDGEIIDSLHCSGHLSLPDERTAYFQGTLSGRVERECVRCLSPFEDIICSSCEAVFRTSNTLGALTEGKGKHSRVRNADLEEDEAETEAYPIVGNHVDLLPMVREHLILATPMQCLCQENCLGLCQVCGINLNEKKCECYMPVTVSSGKTNAQQNIVKPIRPRATRR